MELLKMTNITKSFSGGKCFRTLIFPWSAGKYTRCWERTAPVSPH